MVDAEIRNLFVEISRLNPHKFDAAIVDLSGLDAVDALSAQSLQNLCRLLKLFGTDPVVAGIEPGIAFSMAVRGLYIENTPVVNDLESAFNYVVNHRHHRRHHHHHHGATHGGEGKRRR